MLFASELRTFLTVESVEHMEVDDAAAGGFRGGAAVLNKQLRINFDVTFPTIACALLSLDAADASGQHSENVIHNVFKRRLADDGMPLSAGEKEETLRVLKTTEELQREKNKAIADGRPATPKVDGQCGDCYGSADAGVCCNTCEEVREAYKKKGWQFNMKGVSQCEQEGFYGDVATQMAKVRGEAAGGGDVARARRERNLRNTTLVLFRPPPRRTRAATCTGRWKCPRCPAASTLGPGTRCSRRTKTSATWSALCLAPSTCRTR